jgi:hypothetical protein
MRPGSWLCLALTLCASLSSAQTPVAGSPWLIVLTPTVNPLPIGGCGPVWLTIKDSTGKSTPRDPAGRLITIADFDMSVASADPNALVGEYNGPSIWSACACQAATIGSSATITATYPAKGLAARARVPNVAFQATAGITISKAHGTYDPPECPHPAALAIATKAGASPPLTMAPPLSPGAPRSPLTAAPPTNVVVNGTPMVAHLSWSAAPSVQGYTVWRGASGQAAVQRTPLQFTGTAFDDTVADPSITYQFTVAANYANGQTASAQPVAFISPALINPSGFTAVHAGGGTVNLQWQPVTGALRYRLDGSGLPNTGLLDTTTSATVNLVPSGPGAWKVTALYAGNAADYTTGATATAMVRVLPSHSLPWLSKNNGAGNTSLASSHYAQLCPGNQATCLGTLATTVVTGYVTPSTMPFWGDAEGQRIAEEAVYANVADLGYGRRTNCTRQMKGPPVPGFLTMCYTTSHGPSPGAPGFADPQIITRAAAGEVPPTQTGLLHGGTVAPYSKNPWGDMARSGTVIIRDPAGSYFFYAFTPGLWDLSPFDPTATWNTWVQVPTTLASVLFDTEGAKALPHSCLSCHGGHWDPTSKRVTGASFLPLDPGALAFGVTQAGDRTTYERSGQEENIRRINQIVASVSPTSAIASYINGLYNGNVVSKGSLARSNYVPAGWAAQSGLYLSVVKPYCANCHLAAPSNVNFASWGNVLQNKALIYNAVCVAHTMPHSEIAFREFWTKNTGPLYLPGLLAAALGYPSCP